MKHTRESKAFLDKRFDEVDKEGVYLAHQPIYGYREGHSESRLIERYVRTYQIMKALSHLEFHSLLDVGAAEGYKAHIAGQLFEVDVMCCDLSQVGCKRAREIFEVESIAADVHDLPFQDDMFDVVMCSETLEHIPDLYRATAELLRVARKAVVISVPHDPPEVVDRNIEDEIPAAHIHSLDLESFEFVQERHGHRILRRKMVSSMLMVPSVLIEAMPREHHDRMRYPKSLLDLYEASLPFLRKLSGKRWAAFMIQLDGFISSFTSSYNAILFVLLKEPESYHQDKSREIAPSQIMEYTVPLHYLR